VGVRLCIQRPLLPRQQQPRTCRSSTQTASRCPARRTGCPWRTSEKTERAGLKIFGLQTRLGWLRGGAQRANCKGGLLGSERAIGRRKFYCARKSVATRFDIRFACATCSKTGTSLDVDKKIQGGGWSFGWVYDLHFQGFYLPHWIQGSSSFY
jgi:hypothetical protein